MNERAIAENKEMEGRRNMIPKIVSTLTGFRNHFLTAIDTDFNIF